ncbi:MAG: hypothetical protein HUJ73_02815 [Eubacterium sp.]|nr:hypothetical protein [Eubacterium sp.]
MEMITQTISTWCGIIVLLVIAIIGVICSLIGAATREEKMLTDPDEEHYVMKRPVSQLLSPLIILVIGVILQFVLDIIGEKFLYSLPWLPIVVKLAAAVIFGFLFWNGFAHVIRRRIFVSGNAIYVTPVFGSIFQTSFSQIRTVANKVVRGGIIGKKIRTKEGNRFEALNSMNNYDIFCRQLDERVELPDLTKRLFGRLGRKKEEVPEGILIGSVSEVTEDFSMPGRRIEEVPEETMIGSTEEASDDFSVSGEKNEDIQEETPNTALEETPEESGRN